MIPPTRHLWFYRCTGLVVICATVGGVTYPLLERIFN